MGAQIESHITTLADNCRQLAETLPLNGMGLPTGFYRPDLLPTTLPRQQQNGLLTLQGAEKSHLPVVQGPQGIDTKSQELACAFTRLDYIEGYPTLDGYPFWSQLPFEPSEEYMLFEAYLQQATQTTRQLYTLRDILEKSPECKALIEKYTIKDLQNMFIIYMWSSRARAYDLFQAAHRRREQEARALETENSHYMLALRLQDIANTYLDTKKEDLLELMTPKAFMELLKFIVQTQRISSGLPANGPSASAPAPTAGTQSLEVTMRSFAVQGGGVMDATDTRANAPSLENRRALIQAMLLGDSGALMMAQELVIKMNPQTAQKEMKQGAADGEIY